MRQHPTYCTFSESSRRALPRNGCNFYCPSFLEKLWAKNSKWDKNSVDISWNGPRIQKKTIPPWSALQKLQFDTHIVAIACDLEKPSFGTFCPNSPIYCPKRLQACKCLFLNLRLTIQNGFFPLVDRPSGFGNFHIWFFHTLFHAKFGRVFGL